MFYCDILKKLAFIYNVITYFCIQNNSFARSIELKRQTTFRPLCVKLLWIANSEFAGILYAKHKGFYKELGIDLRIEYRNPRVDDVVDNIISEKCDVGIYAFSSLAHAVNNGYNVKAFAVSMQTPGTVIISLQSENIRSIKDLKGRIFGYYSDHDIDIIKTVLAKNNMTINDIKLKVIPISSEIDSLIKKQVDVMLAYETNQPIIFGLRNIPINILYTHENGFTIYGDTYFARTQFIKKNITLLRDFLIATNKGWLAAFAENDAAVSYIVDHEYPKGFYIYGNRDTTLRQQKVQLKMMFKYLTDGVGLQRIGEMNPRICEIGLNIFKAQKLMPTSIQTSDVISMAILDALYRKGKGFGISRQGQSQGQGQGRNQKKIEPERK